MRKEFIVAICCLTVGACIVFSIGVWGALRKSEVVKPASVEDTEVSEEILPEPVKEDTEVVMSDVETSVYLEEYISEMESESVERAVGISVRGVPGLRKNNEKDKKSPAAQGL